MPISEIITEENTQNSKTIKLPSDIRLIIPYRAISWNKIYSSPHWSIRKKLSDEWKWIVKASLMKQKVSRETIDRPVSLDFKAYMGRPIDCDNIWLKGIIDGLREWGILRNDSPQFVKSIAVSVIKDKNERIEVSLY